jgi:predicted RNase H-like nuclease (RuvC/YqgF family)
LLEVLSERQQVEGRLTVLTKEVMAENQRLSAELNERITEVDKLEQRVETLTNDVIAQDRQRRAMVWALERIVHLSKTCEDTKDGMLEMAETAAKALP